MSSSQIPGNEEAIFGVLDGLAKIGARVVTNAESACMSPVTRPRATAVPLQRGPAPQRDAGHGTGGCCGPMRRWRAHRRAGGAIVLAENGVSVDLVAGQASVAGAVPSGKMFVDGLVTGDVGETVVGERLTLSSGFIGVTVVLRSDTGKLAAPPQLHSRGFSEDPKALEPATRKVQEALEALPREGSPMSPASPRRCAARSASGSGDLSPPADDRADGHRDLATEQVPASGWLRPYAATRVATP